MEVTRGKAISLEYPFTGIMGDIKVTGNCRSRDGELSSIEAGQVIDVPQNRQLAQFTMNGGNIPTEFYDFGRIVEAATAQKEFIDAVKEQFAAEQ